MYLYNGYIYVETKTSGLKNAIEDENYEYPCLVPILKNSWIRECRIFADPN